MINLIMIDHLYLIMRITQFILKLEEPRETIKNQMYALHTTSQSAPATIAPMI